MLKLSWVALLLLFSGLPTRAQPGPVGEPPKSIPPDAKRTILDLKYEVQDLVPKMQDLQVNETDTEVHIDLAADVLFDFDKSDILPRAQQTLHQAAEIIRDKEKGLVQIEGYTDARGSDVYNQKLSERRAKTVRDWMMNKESLKHVHFSIGGFGTSKPVAPNTKPDGTDNPEGRQKNRRVEIIVKKR
jgi:outer membrane protein OmpA-like peptidoglycan-associated protein